MLHTLLLILKWLAIIVTFLAITLTLGTWLFLKFAPTFGGHPDSDTLSRIKASPNFNGEAFVNLVPTKASTIDISDLTSSDEVEVSEDTNTLWQFIFPPKGKNPSQPINTQPLTLKQTPLNNGEFVWLGHSTVFFKTASKTIITDPVFHRASPVPIGFKPFAMTYQPTANDLPFIDIVLISHDHYDHLDHKAIMQIKDNVGHFYVPLGVKSHLVRWGVSKDKISEFDWYESVEVGGKIEGGAQNNKNSEITLTFAPTRHFSGRRIKGHRTTLWGSWALQSPDLSVYFSGDGGYSDEFAKIGERFGGFDVAFIEDGAYNEQWRDVHMLPEESAQAGIDVGAKVVLPIHWGKFDLSKHHWREPVRRIKLAFDSHNAGKTADEQVKVATPRIGQVFDLQDLPVSPWWEEEP